MESVQSPMAASIQKQVDEVTRSLSKLGKLFHQLDPTSQYFDSINQIIKVVADIESDALGSEQTPRENEGEERGMEEMPAPTTMEQAAANTKQMLLAAARQRQMQQQ